MASAMAVAGPMLAQAGLKFGTSLASGAGTMFGSMAVKGLYNVITGNGPIQRRKKAAAAASSSSPSSGGCSCGPTKPSYSCEEKCAYGRMMSEKCQGCKGYSGKKPGGYRSSYSRGYSSSRPSSNYVGRYGNKKQTPSYTYKNGARPARQGKLAWRDMKKTIKHPKRSARKDIGGPKWGKRR